MSSLRDTADYVGHQLVRIADVPAVQLTAGLSLAVSPVWIEVLKNVNLIGTTIMVVCGVIMSIRGVYRIWRRRDEQRGREGEMK